MRKSGYEIRNDIVSLLERYLASHLSYWDGIRSTTTPTPLSVSYKYNDLQTPFVHVELTDDDYENYIGGGWEEGKQNYMMNIMVVVDSFDDNEHDYLENYIDSIARLLNDDNTLGFTQIKYISTQRGDIYDNNNNISRAAIMKFQIQIN